MVECLGMIRRSQAIRPQLSSEPERKSWVIPFGGPVLIVVSVLVVLYPFWLFGRLTNQHVDVLEGVGQRELGALLDGARRVDDVDDTERNRHARYFCSPYSMPCGMTMPTCWRC